MARIKIFKKKKTKETASSKIRHRRTKAEMYAAEEAKIPPYKCATCKSYVDGRCLRHERRVEPFYNKCWLHSAIVIVNGNFVPDIQIVIGGNEGE